MGDLPEGVLTFLFSDIEGCTRLWEERTDEMGAAVAAHDRLVRDAVTSAGLRPRQCEDLRAMVDYVQSAPQDDLFGYWLARIVLVHCERRPVDAWVHLAGWYQRVAERADEEYLEEIEESLQVVRASIGPGEASELIRQGESMTDTEALADVRALVDEMCAGTA